MPDLPAVAYSFIAASSSRAVSAGRPMEVVERDGIVCNGGGSRRLGAKHLRAAFPVVNRPCRHERTSACRESAAPIVSSLSHPCTSVRCLMWLTTRPPPLGRSDVFARGRESVCSEPMRIRIEWTSDGRVQSVRDRRSTQAIGTNESDWKDGALTDSNRPPEPPLSGRRCGRWQSSARTQANAGMAVPRRR